MQYADNCAVLGHTPVDLQKAITVISDIYRRFCLKVNTNKTEVPRHGGGLPADEPLISIGGRRSELSEILNTWTPTSQMSVT